jgi:RimJ/RimL family protein N-acetyltransferase
MQSYKEALVDRAILETPRLKLRPPAEPDLQAIAAIAGDWEVASRLSRMPHPYSEADARFFLDIVVPEELVWLIEERSSHGVVGVIG